MNLGIFVEEIVVRLFVMVEPLDAAVQLLDLLLGCFDVSQFGFEESVVKTVACSVLLVL